MWHVSTNNSARNAVISASMCVFFVMVFVAVLIGVPQPIYADSPPKDDGAGLPASWKIDEVSKAIPPLGAKGSAFVLAWMIRTHRDVRLEVCLVLKELDKDYGSGRWVLAVVCRSSNREIWNVVEGLQTPQFEPTLSFPPPIQLHKTYARCPDNKEINSFISAVDPRIGWSFDIDTHWDIIGAYVREDTWRQVVGEPPTKFFRARKAE